MMVMGTEEPQVLPKKYSTQLHHQQQPELLEMAGWIHAFMLFTTNSEPFI